MRRKIKPKPRYIVHSISLRHRPARDMGDVRDGTDFIDLIRLAKSSPDAPATQPR